MDRNPAPDDEDHQAWIVEQARLLRAGDFAAIDAENLAAEIEGIGRSDRREFENRLAELIAHLLKWRHQPAFRSRSWSATLDEERLQIGYIFVDAPGLRSLAPGMLTPAYELARLRAVAATGLADGTFPEECPFTLEQILSPNFLPNG
jgi:hypothetical protein